MLDYVNSSRARQGGMTGKVHGELATVIAEYGLESDAWLSDESEEYIDHDEQKALSVDLWRSISELPDRQQRYLLGVYVGGLTNEEIARAEGITRQAVNSVVQEAIKTIRNKLVSSL